jgi:uncharacterized cupin superfamily protein
VGEPGGSPTLTFRSVIPEAPLEQTDVGLVPKGDGWFVLNAKDARWYYADGRPALCDLQGDTQFPQLGFWVYVLWPGQAVAMDHWEADQEDFLVVSGEGLLLVEGEERPLRSWDFVHCPPNTSHVILGAGDGPCVVVAVGARDRSVDNPDWGGYPVEEVALHHGAGVEQETSDPQVAYANVTPRREPTRYRAEWLP